jgi:cysteinyl-tRNA synthetase
MSKSLGNVVTLRNVLDTWGRETLLVYHLRGHWSKPVDFTDDALQQAAAQAENFRNVFREPSRQAEPEEWDRFAAALDDDFNTAEALAVMNSWRDHELLLRALSIFGLASLAEWEEAPPEVVDLAEQRQRARATRDFTTADQLREAIEAAGWEARDVEDGYQLVPK